MKRLLLSLMALGACSRPSETPIAKVGELAITQAEFKRKLSEVAQGYEHYVMTPSGRRQFLDVIIREKLILAAAAQSGVTRSPEYQEEMARLRAEAEERLREAGDYLLTRLWIDRLRRDGVLSAGEEEARAYHRKHPEEVQVRHILYSDANRAADAIGRVRAGASFAGLAKTDSLDAATAVAGGLMPPAIFGEVIPELEEVVFRMRVGETSGPIKSKFGYHILRKESQRSLDFEASRERVERLLEKQKLDRHLQSIQEKFPVEVVDDQFK